MHVASAGTTSLNLCRAFSLILCSRFRAFICSFFSSLAPFICLVSSILLFVCACPFIPFSSKCFTALCVVFHKISADSPYLPFVPIWLDLIQQDKVLTGFSGVASGIGQNWVVKCVKSQKISAGLGKQWLKRRSPGSPSRLFPAQIRTLLWYLDISKYCLV